MTMINIDKSQVFVNVQGEGEAILFLHGVPDTSEVWNQAIASLSKHYRCIAPDLPGFGRTIAPRNFDYSLNNLADFIDKLLVTQNASNGVHLVIHDIGGIVGLAWALSHPEKVKSLTIMDTVFFSDYKWHAMAKTWRKPVLGELMMYLMRFKQFRAAMKSSTPSLTEEQIRSNYDMLSFRNRRMMLRFYRALDPSVFKGWEEKLPALAQTIPYQVIWGKKDTFLPVALANRFGTTNVNIFENTGHWPMLEHVESVNKLIRQNIELAK